MYAYIVLANFTLKAFNLRNKLILINFKYAT